MPFSPEPGLRVLLVDDSSFARKLISDALKASPGVHSVVTAPSGAIALAKCAQSQPDVAVLDLEMPEMDGIALSRELRRLYPGVRILIHTGNGVAAQAGAIQALTEGASDVLLKPQLARAPYEEQVAAMRAHLLPRIVQFGAARRAAAPPPRQTMPVGGRPRALVIGVSTGGPEALATLLPRLPATFPAPVLVVQHMPVGFTAALAARLDRLSALRVAEASDQEPLVPGRVYLAPAGWHLAVGGTAEAPIACVTGAPPENSCRPSADVLLRSAATVFGGRVIALVLTGMGVDGLAGARACKAAGARVLVQDEETSVVWGMPGAIAEAGLADDIMPLDALPDCLVALAQGRTPPCTR